MEDQIICNCFNVSESAIVEAIKNGADTVEKITEATNAGNGCGQCLDAVAEVLAKN